MSTDLSLRIVVGATDAASNVVQNIAGNIVGKISGINPVAGIVAGGLLAIVGGAVAVGITSTKMAADYQQSMLKVQALTGLTQQQTQDMSNSILQMATVVGQSPKSLADGLYFVASAGFRGADALNILKLSAEAAATGGFDTKTAADALTSALNAFGFKGKDAAHVMDIMTATVTAGKMEWGNYANVVGKLSVISKASGVSFTEANAALATLTNSGYSARLAGTSLGNLFTTLDLKTDSLAKHAAKLGITFDEQKFKSMSLADQIHYLDKATGGNQSTLLALMGSNATALKTFDALKGSIGQYTANLHNLNHAQGATANAFAITQTGFNQSMNRLKAGFDVLMITIGQQLLPVVTKVINQVAPLLTQFAEWITKSGVLQGAIQGFSKWVEQLWTMVKPLVLQFGEWIIKNHVLQDIMLGLQLAIKFIGAAILFVLPYIIQIIQGLVQFGQEIAARLMPTILQLVGFFRTHWTEISGIVHGAWNFIVGVIKYAWALISGIFKMFIDILTGNWKQLWVDFQDMLSGAWAGLKQMFSGGIEVLWNLIKLLWANIAHTFSNAWQNSVVGPITSFWGKLTAFAAGWPTQAVTWGKNLIQGIINGITGMFGSIGNTMHNLVGFIGSFLPHSPAKQGELSHLDEYGPSFVRGFAQGIEKSQPRLEASLKTLVAPIAMMQYARPIAPSPVTNNNYNTSLANPTSSLLPAGNGTQSITYIIINAANCDAKEVARQVRAELDKDLRRSGNLVTITSGGRA